MIFENESMASFANDLADEAPMKLGVVGPIRLPPELGNAVFQITSLMLHYYK